jgi:GT2 family glycosyltransferase
MRTRAISETPAASVIVSTYNWPEALSLVLDSLRYQTRRDFEVIVADDGSKQETRDLIRRFALESGLTVKHFWQQDDGFRPSRSRNGAVSLAEGGYLIFVDGDCCLLPDFVASHLALAEQGWFVAGRRCYLKRGMTDRILRRSLAHYRWPKVLWFLLALTGQSNRPFQFVSLPVSDSKRKRRADKWEKVQTCNLGVWRTDFIAVDGFDISYEGHGMEDSDFVLRLIRAGLGRKDADHTSPVLHLFHPRRDSTTSDGVHPNAARFQDLTDSERKLSVRGLADTIAEAASSDDAVQTT